MRGRILIQTDAQTIETPDFPDVLVVRKISLSLFKKFHLANVDRYPVQDGWNDVGFSWIIDTADHRSLF